MKTIAVSAKSTKEPKTAGSYC